MIRIDELRRDHVIHTGIEEIVQFHKKGDGPIPKDLTKIQGNQVLKFAARYAEHLIQKEHKEVYAIALSHPSFNSPANGYAPETLLLNSSAVEKIPHTEILTGKHSIGVNGFVQIKPVLYKKLKELMKKS